MKHFLAFLKATLLGGVIFVLPAWLTVVLVYKAVMHLQIFVKPVSSHLPRAIAHPKVIAILLLIALCFLVGVAIQTALGARAKRLAEREFLEKLPGYPLNLPAVAVMQCISKWGGGSDKLVAAYDAVASTTSSLRNQKPTT